MPNRLSLAFNAKGGKETKRNEGVRVVHLKRI